MMAKLGLDRAMHVAHFRGEHHIVEFLHHLAGVKLP